MGSGRISSSIGGIDSKESKLSSFLRQLVLNPSTSYQIAIHGYFILSMSILPTQE